MLRTRLSLGLFVLLLILLTIGFYSVNRCSELGKRFTSFSALNRTSANDVMILRRSSAGMTASLLLAVTGDRTLSRQNFAAAARDFTATLRRQRARSDRTPDEIGTMARLDEGFAAYAGQAAAFLRRDTLSDEAGARTAGELGKATAQLSELIDRLESARQAGMESSDRLNGEEVNATVRSIIFFMIAALMTFIYAALRLRQGLLAPLQTIAASIQKVGEGNLDQNIPVPSSDELGVLSVSFNKMAEQLRHYREATSVELLRLDMTIRATLASFPDPVFVLNAAGAIEFRNPAADQLAVKLLFSGVTRLPEKVEEKVATVRASGEDYLPMLFNEAIKFHVDGQDHYYLPRVVLLRDDKRETFGVAVILEDVTRMLLLDDVKSNLISTVSHELKTPLTSVRMALYLLVEKTVGDLNDKQLELVETAREDADRLLRTLNDLLDLARLEHGSYPLDLRPVAPQEMVEEAIRVTRELATAAAIPVRMQIEEKLPPVSIDRQRLAYVVTNLLSNAIKYSPPGVPIEIKVGWGEMRSGHRGIRFSICDRGRGIAPEHQEHIFDRFYRTPGTTQSGAGLGLSIAREVVVAHQGEIGVVSRLGEGSEFFFLLPDPQAEPPRQPHP